MLHMKSCEFIQGAFCKHKFFLRLARAPRQILAARTQPYFYVLGFKVLGVAGRVVVLKGAVTGRVRKHTRLCIHRKLRGIEPRHKP